MEMISPFLLEKIDKLNWDNLSENSGAILLLEAFPERINYSRLSKNPKAIHILDANRDKIDLDQLQLNPNVISLFQKGWSLPNNNFGNQFWNCIEMYQSFVYPNSKKWKGWMLPNFVKTIMFWFFTLIHRPFGLKYMHLYLKLIFYLYSKDNESYDTYCDIFDNNGKFNGKNIILATNCAMMSSGNYPNTISYLEANPRKIDWFYLSSNTEAIHLLEAELLNEENRVDWDELSKNPEAIHLLEAQVHLESNFVKDEIPLVSSFKTNYKIHWPNLCTNPNAIPLLEAHLDKIHLSSLCLNANILELCNYSAPIMK